MDITFKHILNDTLMSNSFSGCLAPSVEKGAEVALAVAPELVSLYGGEDLVLRQVVVHAAARRLFVSTQLAAELPLPSGRDGHVGFCAVRFLSIWLNGGAAARARCCCRRRWNVNTWNAHKLLAVVFKSDWKY